MEDNSDLKELMNSLNYLDSKAELITRISLNYCNISDIKIFCEAKLINLKTLDLTNNFISNIEYLPSSKFKDIENLIFAVNKIGDDNIKYLSQLDFKNLNILNIFQNNFTDFKLFELCNNKNLKNLKNIICRKKYV